jgi:hypothetical protein
MSRVITCNRCKAVTETELPALHSDWVRLDLQGGPVEQWQSIDLCPTCAPPLRQLIDDYVKETT